VNFIDMKSKVIYVNPEFQEMLDFVPKHLGRKVDLSFDIAKRIHDILERKGWSQADFARAAGKKETEISKWMSGHCNFSLRTVAFIEVVLGESILFVG
jgi:ribosome-binding protein aMBF1 (putative translation factor)